MKGIIQQLAPHSRDTFVVSGINDKRQLVGARSYAGIFSYDRYASNVVLLQRLAVPGATVPYPGPATFPTAINNAGQVVGTYSDSTGVHGFLYAGGRYATLNVPGAAPGSTFPAAINNRGEIVGRYGDARSPNTPHGFLERNGVFTTLDFPGTSGGTSATGINDRGVVVGSYIPLYNGHVQPQFAGFIATPQP